MLEINKIYNMDCIIGLKQLPDNYFDLTVTSPPYDSLRTYNNNIEQWTFEKFQAVARELYRVTKEQGIVVWIVADMTTDGSKTGTSFKQALYFKECGFNIHDTMIWKKEAAPYQHKNRYINCFEYMFIFSKGRIKEANLICDRKNKHTGRQIHGTDRQKDGTLLHRSATQISKAVKEYGARLNVWEVTSNKCNKTNHPAVFPKQLAIDHIITWSNEGQLVLDPFMGSGTTAFACVETNRKYIGFELDKAYYDETENRIKEYRINRQYSKQSLI